MRSPNRGVSGSRKGLMSSKKKFKKQKKEKKIELNQVFNGPKEAIRGQGQSI